MPEFLSPQRVTIDAHRWTADIEVVDAEGKIHNFIASADSADTMNDGLWFGTSAEYEERW